ncbi:putative MFS family arabinose efflux permease [Oryzihumus leptocrescens]|uniref:Putative MFS family arabinose efflux permease n=1 Tax=Oryzihumus leptocrescens TaxID=297536 RepID=A0A542ZP56_9MICO|nr:putative MFS family arabinose efflux permease [Oryzihumus leptocrescens]
MRRAGALGPDFSRLWLAYGVSSAGSALSAGALPLVAVTLLHATTLQVSLLATVSGLASAVLVLPLGGHIEHHRKRPVMVVADLLRAVASLSVPAAALSGVLTYGQLLAVAVVNTAGAMVFLAASGAHLKALVPAPLRPEANGRFESVFWLTNSAGPPAGGALVALFGSTITLALDGLSFLASAAGIRSLRRPEPDPAPAAPTRRLGREVTAGWPHVFGHRGLRALFWNAMLFGGAVMMAGPLTAVLMLRELGLPAWQYGLVLGLPCLGGVLGSSVSARLVRRHGQRRILLAAGLLRTPWLVLLPLAGRGVAGLAVLLVAETGLLVAAGVFNPVFATYRMEQVADGFLARVTTSWSIGSKVAQPLFIALGGVVGAWAGIRPALGLAAACCAASAVLLPWRSGASAPDRPREAPLAAN